MSIAEGYYHHPHVKAQVYPNYESAVLDGLGDEEALKRAFATMPGGATIYGDLLNLIQAQVRTEITRAEMKAKPYVIAAALFGFGGILLGLSTLLRRG